MQGRPAAHAAAAADAAAAQAAIPKIYGTKAYWDAVDRGDLAPPLAQGQRVVIDDPKIGQSAANAAAASVYSSAYGAGTASSYDQSNTVTVNVDKGAVQIGSVDGLTDTDALANKVSGAIAQRVAATIKR